MSGIAPGVIDAARRSATGPAGERPSGPAGTRPRMRGDATAPAGGDRLARMARGFVTLFLEVEAGRRPRSHLAPLLTPMLYARLCEVWVRGGAPGTVVTVRVAGRSADGVDVVAMVRRGGRYGAVALQLVASKRGWLVGDVALPEHGPLPLPAYPVPLDDDDEDADPVPLPLAAPLKQPQAVAAGAAPLKQPQAVAAGAAPLKQPQAVAGGDWLPVANPG